MLNRLEFRIDMIDIIGSIVVADALYCKKKSVEKLIEEKGDYVFIEKDNEATLRKDIELFVQNEELNWIIVNKVDK